MLHKLFCPRVTIFLALTLHRSSSSHPLNKDLGQDHCIHNISTLKSDDHYQIGFLTNTLLVLLFMEFGSSSVLSKKPDGISPSTPQKTGAKRHRGLYMGARLRDGKWVAEIRIPKTKKRIWLGSHDTAEAAAQAYDDASYCIYGAEGPCNFPNNRRPQVASQLIGSKSTDEILRIVEESTSAGNAKVPDMKSPSKLSSCHLVDKPVVQDHLDLGEMAAHKVSPEPIVTSNMSVVEPYVPELDFPSNAFEMEPYIPYFAPEEPPFSWGSLPFDEAFIKESDDWILDFMAEPATKQDGNSS